MANYYLGVDMGGTLIKIAIVDDKANVIEEAVVNTDINASPKSVIENITEVFKKFKNYNKVKTIGIGIAGDIDFRQGIVRMSPNLPKWNKVHLKKDIEKVTGKIVYVDNDANTAALGEYKCGTGADYDGIVFLTLGTGVGGGIIYDGKIIQGFSGYGGEVGHIKVNYDETKACNCGTCGCLEQYASSTGIRRMALRRLSQGDEESSLRDYGEELTTKDIFIEAEENGDKVANEVIDYAMEMLARACADICHVVNVEAVIIGGGVANAGGFLLDKLRKEFEKKEACKENDWRNDYSGCGSYFRNRSHRRPGRSAENHRQLPESGLFLHPDSSRNNRWRRDSKIPGNRRNRCLLRPDQPFFEHFSGRSRNQVFLCCGSDR